MSGLVALGGCRYGQTTPPSPEGQQLALERTATGTRLTKLEARPMPYPLRPGLAIWDLKVFASQDQETGRRAEWRSFRPLPDKSSERTSTEALMRAWIVSQDRAVFLPRTPSYKGYGSFVTDWNLPRAGEYTLFVEYLPAARGEVMPVEQARWPFRAMAASSPALATSADNSVEPDRLGETPVLAGGRGETMVELRALDAREPGLRARVTAETGRIGEPTLLRWEIVDAADAVRDRSWVALAPGGDRLRAFHDSAVRFIPEEAGQWDLLFHVVTEQGRQLMGHVVLSIAPAP